MNVMTQPGSAYSLEKRDEKPETHTMSVLVDNEPGVLARVIGLFSGRGYNIDSLTVSETEHEAHLSRITIVTSGPPMVIEQIKNQLDRLVPIHSVTDLTLLGNPVERELALVKVTASESTRGDVLSVVNIFRGKVVDVADRSYVLEVTGSSEKIGAFVDLLRPFGILEVVRTGIVAVYRGSAVLAADALEEKPQVAVGDHAGRIARELVADVEHDHVRAGVDPSLALLGLGGERSAGGGPHGPSSGPLPSERSRVDAYLLLVCGFECCAVIAVATCVAPFSW